MLEETSKEELQSTEQQASDTTQVKVSPSKMPPINGV